MLVLEEQHLFWMKVHLMWKNKYKVKKTNIILPLLFCLGDVSGQVTSFTELHDEEQGATLLVNDSVDVPDNVLVFELS